MALTKADIMFPDQNETITEFFNSQGIEVVSISAVTGHQIDILIQKLVELLK